VYFAFLIWRQVQSQSGGESEGDLLMNILFLSTLPWLGSERNLDETANRFWSTRAIRLLGRPIVNSAF
jgi:hypothetical protein